MTARRAPSEAAALSPGGYLSNSGSEWRSTGETKPPAARPEDPSDGESHARPVFGAPCPVRRARRRGRAQPDLSRYPPVAIAIASRLPRRQAKAIVGEMRGFRAKQGAARAGRDARHQTKAGLMTIRLAQVRLEGPMIWA